MKSRLVSNRQITASSAFCTWGIEAFTWHPHYARLDKQGKTNAWTAATNNRSEWLQVMTSRSRAGFLLCSPLSLKFPSVSSGGPAVAEEDHGNHHAGGQRLRRRAVCQCLQGGAQRRQSVVDRRSGREHEDGQGEDTPQNRLVSVCVAGNRSCDTRVVSESMMWIFCRSVRTCRSFLETATTMFTGRTSSSRRSTLATSASCRGSGTSGSPCGWSSSAAMSSSAWNAPPPPAPTSLLPPDP